MRTFGLVRLRRIAVTAAIFLVVLAAATTAQAANKLWLAWDSSTAGCQQRTTDFFNCILDNTNFNALSLQYHYGESITVGGTANIGGSCGPTDFQCVVNAAGFHPAAYDIVMHFYGTGWAGGTNGTATVTVSGHAVVINTAWVQTGDNCDGQTCSGAHEAYEAATDGVSADCCNGQYGHSSCSQCQPSCARYDGNNGNPPYGCYSFTCNGTSYKMELLGAASNEFSAAGCTELTVQNSCPALHAACTPSADGGSACCSGLSCEKFSLSGQPPFNDACCYAIGAACTTNTDCCGGSNCDSAHKCACVPAGQWCINAGECCGGYTCDLQSNKCVAVTPDAGAVDAAGADAGHAEGGPTPPPPTGRDSGAADAGPGTSEQAGDEAGVTPSAPDNPAGCSCGLAGPSGRAGSSIAAFALGLASLARRRRSRRRRCR